MRGYANLVRDKDDVYRAKLPAGAILRNIVYMTAGQNQGGWCLVYDTRSETLAEAQAKNWPDANDR